MIRFRIGRPGADEGPTAVPFRRALDAHRLAGLIILGVVALAGCSDAVAPPAGPVAPTGIFSQVEIDYYVDVALGTEFGGGAAVVRKWATPIAIHVLGTPGARDITEVERVVTELRDLMGGAGIDIVDQATPANVEVHFATQSEFPSILPQWVPGNSGFVWVSWNGAQQIVNGTVLIDISSATSQSFRNHLIREEVTQSLGLLRDSPRFPGSIFFSGSTPAPDEFLDIDRTVVRIHARADIQPGMAESTVRSILATAR